MMNQEFLPQKPPLIQKKDLITHFKKLFKQVLYNFRSTFCLFEFGPKKPKKEYPSSKENFSSGQKEQCKQAFKNSQKRMVQLENKALELFKTSTWIIPLCGGVLGFLLKGSFSKSPLWKWTLIVFSILWALCLASAVLATFRARNIREIQSVGIDAIIDTKNEKLHDYDIERDSFGLLWCAKMNEAVSDLKADFIKAAQMFISISMIFLLIGAFLVGIKYSRNPEKDKYLEAINTFHIELQAIANEIGSVTSKEKNLSTRIEDLIKKQDQIEKKMRAITHKKEK